MKKLRLTPSLFLVLLLSSLSQNLKAQSYTVSFPSNGYTANSSPTTIHSSSVDDAMSGAINIGFTFQYGCVNYTQIRVSSNGWLTFNTAYSSNDFSNNLASGSNKPVIAPLWDDLATSSGGNVNYQLSGTSPNQVLTIEWKQMAWTYSASADVISFQVKLYETSNSIDFIYKQGGSAVNSGSASIGIAPTSVAGDYYSLNGTGATPTANYGSETSNLSTKPADTEVYRWTPGSMSYSSCTTTQPNTTNVEKCSDNQEIVCVQVVTTGGCGAANAVSGFQINMNGTTATVTNQVSTIHIYYTGTSSIFAATNEFVSGGISSAAGTISFTGSTQTLSAGTNYFWVAYDIIPTAPGTTLDAECTQVTVTGTGGGVKTPTATAPAGTRTLTACSGYPGTSALGLKHWVKSDAGVTGNPVSAWGDQSGAGITGNMAQATAANRPSVQSNAVNFQDYIRFDGSNDILASANTFTGGTLFNTTDNTVLMIKNYKGGLVDYKWETDPTNSWRIGMELNGTAQRIDFVDDNGGGKNDVSTTNILNKDVLVEYLSDAATINLKLNANLDATKTHPSLTFSPGGAISKSLYIGANDLGNPLYCQVDIAEVLTYNKKLSSSELRRVESYLCLKFGLTLGNNKGTGSSLSYYASDGTQIWNNHSGYHNYVVGIGRDNTAGNSGLHKLKSTSVTSLNGSVDIITLANSNFTTPAAFANDKAFLLVGSNAGTLATPVTANYTHGGPATAIVYQTSRVWSTQKTGTHSGNLIIEFDMAQINGPGGYGGNTNSDIRLLVDNDINFSNASAGEHTYTPNAGYSATGGKIYFTVPYSDIQTGTGYFAIGSINGINATLPVDLASLTVDCGKENSFIHWANFEENNNHYEVQKSDDALTYRTIGTVNASQNPGSLNNYEFIDQEQKLKPFSYYRLKQYDNNGASKYFSPTSYSSDCYRHAKEINVYPNPTSSELFVELTEEMVNAVQLIDNCGKLVFELDLSEENPGILKLDLSQYKDGIYCLKLIGAQDLIVKKIIKQTN